MSPVSLSVAGRRLFLRNGGAAALSGAAVVLLADREALAMSATVSQTNLHDSAPTQFQAVGDVPTVNSFILQQKLPDARLILFPDSGHGAHFQFPEEFAEAAARFLAAD